MPFLLYQTSPAARGTNYKAVGGFKFAGGGLVRQACQRHLTPGKDGGWTLSREELLQARQVSPKDHQLVVDTSPGRETANLYEIRSVSGFSYRDWTPIMICFQSLFTDDTVVEGEVASLDEFKKAFNDIDCPRDFIRSVLYLRGGHAAGGWNFGGNNRTTAALMWEDAWAFFSQVPAG